MNESGAPARYNKARVLKRSYERAITDSLSALLHSYSAVDGEGQGSIVGGSQAGASGASELLSYILHRCRLTSTSTAVNTATTGAGAGVPADAGATSDTIFNNEVSATYASRQL